MIQLQQVKLRPDHTQAELENKIRQLLRIPSEDLLSYEILRQSVDAHRRPEIFLVYTLEAKVRHEADVLRRCRKNSQIRKSDRVRYRFPYQASETGSDRPVIVGAEQGSDRPVIVGAKQGSDRPVIVGAEPESDRPVIVGAEQGSDRPVIVGAGPAGLFCALMLARAGLHPIVIERGAPVEERTKDVQRFWEEGVLDPESNVQFGEGGAGTFSDGKLNTAVKDPKGRIRFVLETFVSFGADPSICYSYKPHIGSDVLTEVVVRMREEIIRLGGSFFFHTCLKDLAREEDGSWVLFLSGPGGAATDGAAFAAEISGGAALGGADAADDYFVGAAPGKTETDAGTSYKLRTRALVLAIGHSARDTFAMLQKRELPLRAKAFAVGLRVQHPQKWIDEAMYGKDCPYDLGPAPYKLTHQTRDGRGVYSFCMCPGGYVVNASSEPGMTAVNGMSYHDRAGENANSAIVVTVSPDQYRKEGENAGPLDGVSFQRELERKAYEVGKGCIPLQRFGDFRIGSAAAESHPPQRSFGIVRPAIKGAWREGDVRSILPNEIADAVSEGMEAFGKKIAGFDHPDVLMCGVESRTSSPVRIERGDDLQAVGFPGIFPCGEGAGYAGGITSAAIDGIRIAEEVAGSILSVKQPKIGI